MSSQNPGSPRRRRIAGERRTARPAEGHQPESVAAAPAPPPAPEPDEQRPTVRPATPPPPVVEDPSRAGTPETDGARRWWGSRPSLLVLAGVLVVTLTLVVLGGLGLLGNDGVADLREADAVDRAAETAPAAAERAAAAIIGYDYRTLDADADAAVRFMSDEFAAKYTETFEKVVKPTATDQRAKVTAVVQGSAVVRASEDRVRVLLFVDQTTVSAANKNPQLALNRVEMVMVKDGDSWVVDDLTAY